MRYVFGASLSEVNVCAIVSVTLDEAIEAMRLTAADMSVKYKETSLSVGRSNVLFPTIPDSYLSHPQGLAVSTI